MEAVYKNKNGFWGMSSGLKYPEAEVHETHEGCYWHAHGVGQPVVEVGEVDGKDTRTHGGYPMYPAKGNSKKGY